MKLFIDGQGRLVIDQDWLVLLLFICLGLTTNLLFDVHKLGDRA